MSPEYLVDVENFSEASDLWPLGIVAFMMFNLNGHPFNLKSNLIQQIMNNDPDFGRLNVRHKKLRPIIRRLLIKQLFNRKYKNLFTNVGRAIGSALGAELRALLDEELYTDLDADYPYAMMISIVRHLCLMVTLTDNEASILKPLVPDIGKLLARDIADARILETEQAAKNRLFYTLRDLLKRVSEPLLLLLEDLQSADSESIVLLTYLAEIIKRKGIHILASCPPEPEFDIKKRFPELYAAYKESDEEPEVTRLESLNEDAICALAMSMLGSDNVDAAACGVLRDISQGNPFILIELIRGIAQQEGNFALGITIEGIILYLLDKIREIFESPYEMLCLAAVGGMDVEPTLLQEMESTVDIDFCLDVGAAYGILGLLDGNWRFTHSVIREVILRQIPKEKLRTQHRRMAKAKIVFYDGGKNHEAAIAHHWQEAGDLINVGDWYLKAAQIAERVYATETAKEYYENAYEYLPSNNPDFRPKHILIAYGLGKLSLSQAQRDDAIEEFKRMREFAELEEDGLCITYALIGLCEAHRDKGNYEDAARFAQGAEEHEREHGRKDSLEMVTVLGHHAFSLFNLQRVEEALAKSEEALNIATNQNDKKYKAQEARSHSTIGIINLGLGNLDAAEPSLNLALHIAEELGDKRAIGVKNLNRGEFYRHIFEWDKARPHLEKAHDLYQDVGYLHGVSFALSSLAGVDNGQGNFSDAEEKILKVFDILPIPRRAPIYAEAAGHLVKALYHQKSYSEALEMPQEWLDVVIEKNQSLSTGLAWHFAALIAGQAGVPFGGSTRDYTALVSSNVNLAMPIFPLSGTLISLNPSFRMLRLVLVSRSKLKPYLAQTLITRILFKPCCLFQSRI
ncbi:MAG: tetratricopeptide repeat protein [Anaerolineae bacterium]|nr:tetratricopeptide repeat protein [Anaerolineae bacterium]MDQ7036762.1 tetratricopeptide repeat protein [Anaerolineae bacterium]